MPQRHELDGEPRSNEETDQVTAPVRPDDPGLRGLWSSSAAFHRSELGKPAIYIGGATQLLFGIRGTRWDEHKELSKLIKINWVSPMLSEIPPLPGAVEDSAYWSQPTIGGQRSHASQIHLIARLNTPLIQLLHNLEDSGYSHHDPTLTIHIVSDQHESHNDRALQVTKAIFAGEDSGPTRFYHRLVWK